MMSVSLSEAEFSVTAEVIGLYSSGNESADPVVVLSYFLGGLNTLNPRPIPTKKK